MKNIPKPKKSERIDLIKLRNHLDDLDLSKEHNLNFWIYCNIAMTTGLRSVDVLNLKVSDINFQKGYARITEQKTKRKVDAKLSRAVLDVINQKQEFAIFNHKYGSRVSLMTINRRLKGVFVDDNVNVSSHSIRKAVGRAIYEKTGNDLVSAMTFLGHKIPATTITYLEINKDKLNELYTLLEW